MRVISGAARGHRLQPVPGDTTRPITDRVKESLFNILGHRVEDACVLDLFAGTGAVGIEALSRGAAHVVFVDKSPAALRTVRLNLDHTRLAGRATVLRADAFKYLAGPIDRPFDLIYVAPPQYRGWWIEVLQVLDARPGWLTQTATHSGIIVAQLHPRELVDLSLRQLAEYDRRKYGSTVLCFFRLRSALNGM
jgi:16S rRNA (guanine(966)-N(2))-methyltransferase RsmD